MRAERVVQHVWGGADPLSVSVRLLLAPLSAAFGAVVAIRNRRFDRGEGVLPTAVPALSVGNLTVGGTGKTPVASWCVRALAAAGARPGVVLRGYGDDEWRVHGVLTPGVPVVRNADRVAGAHEAQAAGADCVVLDDAFQHRRAARVVDLVLVSADAWTGACRLLPAGPFREPLAALRRASVVVITRKVASDARVAAVRCAISAAAPSVPIAELGLEADGLRSAGELGAVGGSARPLTALAGRRVLAVSAIGDPAAFEARLRATGAQVEPRRWPDHHAFTAAECAALASAAGPDTEVVCTLKDAVKLAPHWPRAAVPLWYVSQSIVVRAGASALDGAVGQVLAARGVPGSAAPPTAG
jgi:tetraacyldisaccharide 4'-kinase